MSAAALLNPDQLSLRIRMAIQNFWAVRTRQQKQSEDSGRAESSSRGAVTGGAHLQGFADLLSELALDCGFTREHVFVDNKLELPGFFRPTKKWDFLVVKDSRLIAAVELKGQVGPSFGNNFNNRTEEAMGTAQDIWVAFREKRLGTTLEPWLGYFFLLEDCAKSNIPVKAAEPHFPVGPEFKTQELVGKRTRVNGNTNGDVQKGSSYALRYELFCEKLVLERLYSASALVLASRDKPGDFREPAEASRLYSFLTKFHAHLCASQKILAGGTE